MSLPKAQKRALPAALVVDDDAAFRGRLAKALIRRNFDTHEAACAAEGLALAQDLQPALVTLDLRMPGGSGLDIVAKLKALTCTPCILLLTGYGSIPTAVEAIKCGAADVLTKPINADQIVAAYEKWCGSACGADRELSVCKENGLRVKNSRSAPQWPATQAIQPLAETTPTLPQVEWDHIQRVLVDCNGNISEAARRLGLHRRSLQRKLDKRPG